MKFTANTTELQRILGKLGGVIPSKSPMAILEYILFDLAGNTLTMTATDQAVWLTVQTDVQGEEDGKIAIPAKRLMDTVRSLSDTPAEFNIDLGTSSVKIVTENGEYDLSGNAAKDFPEVPEFKASSEISMDAPTLRRLIHRTSFAVSSDELRPAMMGVLLQGKGNELRAVATDGHRLVRVSQKHKAKIPFDKDFVIPVKALHVQLRSMEDGDWNISVSKKDNKETHVKFSSGRTFLVSRLIEETYPNYEAVIPSDNEKIMKVKRDALINSIRRVALYANASTHQVRFEINGKKIKLTAKDSDFGGEAKETIACEFSSDILDIGFNSVYLVDILTHLESEDVEFRFSTPTRAGIISPVAEESDENVLMLVMPVRLNA